MIRFKKLTALEDRRLLDSGLKRQLDWYVISDILADRFKKIFKEKELLPEKFSKEVMSGTYWYVPRWHIQRYPDGTHTDTPRDRLSDFLNHELMSGPEKSNLYLLEGRLGYPRGQIVTVFHEHLGVENFLWALGYINDQGRQSRKYETSPRIQKYLALKRKEERNIVKAGKDYEKKSKEEKARLKEIRKKKYAKIAMGLMDSDGFVYEEEV